MHARGIVVMSRLRFLHARYPNKVDLVLAQILPGDRQLLQSVLPVSQIPMDTYVRFNDAIAHLCEPDEPERVFVDMGRASAEANLSEHQKFFLRDGDPQEILSAASRLHKYYHDKGRIDYERLAEKTALLRIFDVDTLSPGDCLTNKGWFQRAVELSGGTMVKVAHTKCRLREDLFCEFLCEWS